MPAAVEVSTQTDPVVVLNGTGFGLGSQAAFGGVSSTKLISAGTWTAADDTAQAEALRTISLLGQHGTQGRRNEGRIAELEDKLRVESASRQEMDAQLAHERNRKEAVQQQVLCLEYELDGKEAALQVSERTLERRDQELQQVQERLRSAQEEPLRPPSVVGSAAGSMAFSAAGPGEDPHTRAVRAQLLERDRQIELKDQHISRLLQVLRQSSSGGRGQGFEGPPQAVPPQGPGTLHTVPVLHTASSLHAPTALIHHAGKLL